MVTNLDQIASKDNHHFVCIPRKQEYRLHYTTIEGNFNWVMLCTMCHVLGTQLFLFENFNKRRDLSVKTKPLKNLF